MPQAKAAHVKDAQLVQFTETQIIEKDRLDRAIRGAIKKVAPAGATFDERAEITARTYLKLVSFFAAGKRLQGEIASLAYRMAYNTAVDHFFRVRKVEASRSDIDAGLAAPAAGLTQHTLSSEGEALLNEQAAIKQRRLAAGIKEISRTDRETLIEMLKRDEPMPRTTAVETRLANLAAQREKRARDRLSRAVRRNWDLER